MLQSILSVMQMIVSFGSICILAYTLRNFLRKPHADLETRVDELEYETKDIKQSLLLGNDRFREQNATNEALITAVLALIEFEVHYCETEHKPISSNLENAKNNLNKYLARNRY